MNKTANHGVGSL